MAQQPGQTDAEPFATKDAERTTERAQHAVPLRKVWRSREHRGTACRARGQGRTAYLRSTSGIFLQPLAEQITLLGGDAGHVAERHVLGGNRGLIDLVAVLLEVLETVQHDAGRRGLEGRAGGLDRVTGLAVGGQQLADVGVGNPGHCSPFFCRVAVDSRRCARRHSPDQGNGGQRADNQNRRLELALIAQVEEVPRVGRDRAVIAPIAASTAQP